jgi:hypothetical protein
MQLVLSSEGCWREATAGGPRSWWEDAGSSTVVAPISDV